MSRRCSRSTAAAAALLASALRAVTLMAAAMGAAACGSSTDDRFFQSPDGFDASDGSSGDAGGDDDASATDGGRDASEGGAGGDAGADANPPNTIRCGSATCTLGTQVCCRREGPPVTLTCTAPGACVGLPGTVLPIPCDDRADCQSSQVCCVTVDNQREAIDVRCSSAGGCNGQNQTSMCDPAASTCGANRTCKTGAVTLPEYHLCLN
jgi:hypothetical protein